MLVLFFNEYYYKMDTHKNGLTKFRSYLFVEKNPQKKALLSKDFRGSRGFKTPVPNFPLRQFSQTGGFSHSPTLPMQTLNWFYDRKCSH